MAIEKVEFFEGECQSLIKQMRVNTFKLYTPVDIIFYCGEIKKLLGCDVEVKSLIPPPFLQLKVADFYPQFGTSVLTVGRKRVLGFNDNPGHYAFSLHLDKKDEGLQAA